MGAPLVDIHDELKLRRTHGVFDDFNYFVTADMWTRLVSDTNTTVSVGNADNGILALFTGDLTDNNEAAIRSTNKLWTIAANQTIVAESGINYTEGNTDDANIAFGLSSVIGADWLLDNGGGPAATQSAAMIYKVDGGTAWKCCSQVSTTSTISTSTTTAGGNQTLRIEVQAQPDGSADVKYFVADQQLLDSTTNQPIKHSITSTNVGNAAAMYLGAYVKAGGTTAAETLNVDYLAAEATRDRIPNN